MSGILRVSRAVALIWHNLVFLLLGLMIDAFPFAGNARKLHIRAYCMMWWARIACLILGVHRTTTGACEGGNVFFVVSNHCSYLDILVIGSIMPTVFVAKKEVAAWSLLGRLAGLAGTVFIDRESRAASVRKLEEIKTRLRSGMSVAAFPEGTTNDGMSIRDFKSMLFQAPIDTEVPVLPLSLLYSHIDGVPVSPETKDRIAWYAEMPFLSHFWELMGIRRIDVRTQFGSPLYGEASGRRGLASFAYEIVKAGHAALRREIEA
ncbi:MAG TPA: lysophospholipid acyltransferase family protein [Dissulfurispiraceae bacterium]